MKNSVNVIVRLSPKLKKDAEEACRDMDINLSECVRRHFRDIIRHYQKSRAIDTRFHREFMEGDFAKAAHDALARELEVKRIELGLSPGDPVPV